MPHRCVKCSAVYVDGAPEMIKGCACGSTAFFYIRSREDPQPGEEKREAVRREADGEYHIDIPALLKQDSVIIREADGKYRIDLEESFKRSMK